MFQSLSSSSTSSSSLSSSSTSSSSTSSSSTSSSSTSSSSKSSPSTSSTSLSSLFPSPKYHTSELDYMKQLAWNEFREKFSVDMTTCTSIKAKMVTIAVVVTEKTSLVCTPNSTTNTNKNSKKEDPRRRKRQVIIQTINNVKVSAKAIIE